VDDAGLRVPHQDLDQLQAGVSRRTDYAHFDHDLLVPVLGVISDREEL